MSERGKLASLFAVLGFLAALPYRNQFHDGLNDECVVLYSACRILSGEVPYRDFDMLYTPLSMFGCAAWFKGFGISIESARWLMTLVGGVITAEIYLVSSKLLKRSFSFFPPVMFAVSGYSEWPVVSYHWFAIACLMAALICFLEWSEGEDTRWLVACGAAVGLAGASLQSEGVSGVLGVSVTLALQAGGGRWRSQISALATFLAGVLLVWLPLLVYFAVLGALGSFVENTVLRVLSGLYVSHGAPYDLGKHVFEPWASFLSQWPASWSGPRLAWAAQSLSMLFIWTSKYALFFPVILGAGYLGFKKRGLWLPASLFLFFWLLVARERLDLLYTNYLTPLWYVALIGCVEYLHGAFPRFGKALAGALAALYFTGAMGAWKHSSGFVYPIYTARGVLYSASPVEARVYQELHATAYKLTPPGTKCFVWPYGAGFYFLADLKNPSRLDFLVPGWQDTTQVELTLEQITSAQVEYLYYFPLTDDLLDDYPNLDPAHFEQGLKEQITVFKREYEPAGRVHHFEIFQRREDRADELRS